ncbi:NADPH-dependent FMN reductase [Puniceicoccus vermicola]|uniref:NAD(P)H-dependent oxidoreductase n=1 Tax=Puniceicoccus vermicola TaxID=388746 RepID=A0A7X1AX34_9BACT|nr:NADPH-dependent FMN reductase [Puniceicoccus vermicola]MBC2601442.1 NAD(P)H-dependent oxidoreductase [Puniceicoccus vermicola]
MRYLIVSCSLRGKSRSRVMAELARNDLEEVGQSVDWLDLCEHSLPFCDGGAAYGDERVGPVAEKVSNADGVILAGPIYNYDFNAASKNLIEMTGSGCWAGKVVGFIAAAGGSSSYMSVLPLANSLMIDFRCVIIPRFVYTDGSAFGENGELENAEVRERIRRLGSDLIGFTEGLATTLQAERGTPS